MQTFTLRNYFWLETIVRRAVAGTFALGFCSVVISAQAASTNLLWQIGKSDQANAEFALAPGDYHRFERDGFFVVGESDPKRDWPYVHPGPQDSWAGSRQHTFSILFGLKKAPSPGQCQLQFELLDAQSQGPPTIRVQVNGDAFERTLAAGAGDESINGAIGKAKPVMLNIEFPATLLKPGENSITITSVSGSWFLYDSVSLDTPAGAELCPVQSRTVVEGIQPVGALKENGGKLMQPVLVMVRQLGGDAKGELSLNGAPKLPVTLTNGLQTFELLVSAVSEPTQRKFSMVVQGHTVAERSVTLKPVRKLTIYVLPHSHTDIGYTEIQTTIEKKQVNNLLQGIDIARATAGYPEGARFVWNVEVAWAADLYLHRLSEAQRTVFMEAVKNGWVALNGMYLNELTGLCRPEELLRLFRYSTQLAEQTGKPIDAAMISDVPGYTWGVVPAMAQAGIKYFSVAPNFFDRIGDILVQWENKPFYWVSPSGKEKVLVWIPFKGYAMSHIYKQMTPEFVGAYQAYLENTQYPYDITYMRWSGHGDNATPDPAICEFIKDWNTKYAYPKFVIASTSQAFRAFETRYGSKIPKVRGDWTPYWEDGAGSSALETGMNRASSERLTQAETLWAMLNPGKYPVGEFDSAWRNVLLYSEHTWGADCSVSDPENQKTKEQWAIKRSYAVAADKASRELLSAAFQNASPDAAGIDVFNTTSWLREDLVLVSKELSAAGDRVTDDKHHTVPSQRLASGELAFIATEVPAFGAKRYTISADRVEASGGAIAKGSWLENGILRVRLDEKTGGIAELRARGIAESLVNSTSGYALNDYLFLAGDDLSNLKGSGPVKIRVKEAGPVVASLLVESDAPGCRRLTREIRLLKGADHVDISDIVNKERAAISPKPGDWSFAQKGGKESVNFAFAFNVPDGEMLLDIPLGVMRPELEQILGSCKNWFTVSRWIDISNKHYGVTFVTLDAPLIEIGSLTARLLGSQANPDVWRKKVDRSQTIYSWAMNNHWGTNYRAYQDGPVEFRYSLQPHQKFTPAEATMFASGLSQPLIAVRATGTAPLNTRLQVESMEGVTVLGLKPADDGKALIVRLFGASGKKGRAKLVWNEPHPIRVRLSDTSERCGEPVTGTIDVPGYGVVTLRVDY